MHTLGEDLGCNSIQKLLTGILLKDLGFKSKTYKQRFREFYFGISYAKHFVILYKYMEVSTICYGLNILVLCYNQLYNIYRFTG